MTTVNAPQSVSEDPWFLCLRPLLYDRIFWDPIDSLTGGLRLHGGVAEGLLLQVQGDRTSRDRRFCFSTKHVLMRWKEYMNGCYLFLLLFGERFVMIEFRQRDWRWRSFGSRFSIGISRQDGTLFFMGEIRWRKFSRIKRRKRSIEDQFWSILKQNLSLTVGSCFPVLKHRLCPVVYAAPAQPVTRHFDLLFLARNQDIPELLVRRPRCQS